MSAAPFRSPDSTRRTLQELRIRVGQLQGSHATGRRLHTVAALAPLLPGEALRAGASYAVDGSTSLAMALMLGPSRDGAWCGVVGMPDFGIEAAAGFGIELRRLILVPHPDDEWLTVMSALIDVLDVIVARPPSQLREADAGRLDARLRQRGATLIAMGRWPRCAASLRLAETNWVGLGQGHGHLRARQVTVAVSGRAGAHQREARLWLPDSAYQIRPVEQISSVGQIDVLPQRGEAAG